MGRKGAVDDIKVKLAELFSNGGRITKIIIAAGLAGIALILLSEFVTGDEKHASEQVEAASAASRLETAMEERLEALLSSIDGVGQVRVLVTLESGVQQVSSDEKSADYLPGVKGVAVVCAGGNSPVISERIVRAVTTALAIPSTRVCVLKMA